VIAHLTSQHLGRFPTDYRILGALVLIAFAHRVAAFASDISTYPLAMGWSETSRYYYGSLFLSGSIYRQAIPPSVLHPTRYLLQAIPFLITRHALWMHRVWQVLLWLGLTAGLAWLLARRLNMGRGWLGAVFFSWAFLYIIMGPVLYHLLVPVILIVAWVRPDRPLQSLAMVLLSSLWAGISRRCGRCLPRGVHPAVR
jgi:hypothetical protein